MRKVMTLIRASWVVPCMGLSGCLGGGSGAAPVSEGDPVSDEQPGTPMPGNDAPRREAPIRLEPPVSDAPVATSVASSAASSNPDVDGVDEVDEMATPVNEHAIQAQTASEAGIEPAASSDERGASADEVEGPRIFESDAADVALDAPDPLPARRVVPIFITATDENPADTERYVRTYNSIVAGVRTWYTDQLASRGNFRFYHEPVRVLPGHYTRAEWDRFGIGGFEYPDGTKTAEDGGCSMYAGALHELTTNGLLERAGLPQPGTSGLVYYVILGGGTNGSCGAGGFLAASELQLLEIAERNCPAGRLVDGATDCAEVGAIAHELGHGFGLPHTDERPNCAGTQSLMHEWWLYDGVGLCEEERTDLLSSGYLYTP